MEGFGVFVGKESVVTVEALNVVLCRRAQLAVGDGSSATVTRRGGGLCWRRFGFNDVMPAFERADMIYFTNPKPLSKGA